MRSGGLRPQEALTIGNGEVTLVGRDWRKKAYALGVAGLNALRSASIIGPTNQIF